MTPFNEAATMRKVYGRLMPLLFAMMFFNYLDRINIGFAALDMNKALGFSPAVFGFAGSIFCRLHGAGSAEQSAAASCGCAALDRADSADMGRGGRGHGLCLRRQELLRAALSARRDGSGLLAGRRGLSDEMVPGAIPRAGRGRLHHRGIVFGGAGRPDFDHAHDLRERRPRLAGLAMDVHSRRHSGDAAGPRHAAHHDRAPRRCRLARRRRKAMARIDARSRARSRWRRGAFSAAARSGRPSRLESRVSLRLRARRHLRPLPVAAADRQEPRSSQQYRSRLSLGRAACSACWARSSSAAVRTAPATARSISRSSMA